MNQFLLTVWSVYESFETCLLLLYSLMQLLNNSSRFTEGSRGINYSHSISVSSLPTQHLLSYSVTNGKQIQYPKVNIGGRVPDKKLGNLENRK